MSKEEKSSLWSQRIREFRSSGQTCKDWCEEHQLPVSTMTYWIRKLKKEEKYTGDAENCLRGLTLLRKNKLSKEITNKTEPIVPIVFGSILR